MFSLIFIVVLSKIFLKKDNPTKSFNYTVFSYIFFYILYLIYFGPIPRYYMGLAITIIGLVGYFFDGSEVSLSKIFSYGLIFASVFLIVRLSSYTAFISNEDLRLFDPRESKEINLEIISLSVYKTNKGAYNFYSKKGFKVFKENNMSFFMQKYIWIT